MISTLITAIQIQLKEHVLTLIKVTNVVAMKASFSKKINQVNVWILMNVSKADIIVLKILMVDFVPMHLVHSLVNALKVGLVMVPLTAMAVKIMMNVMMALIRVMIMPNVPILGAHLNVSAQKVGQVMDSHVKTLMNVSV